MSISDLLVKVEEQVSDVQAKKEVFDAAEREYNKANADLSASKAELENLRVQVHEALGNVFQESSRVRQF